MARVIRCECGFVVRGDTEAELLSEADRHTSADHPELVGLISHQDFLDMAEEV